MRQIITVIFLAISGPLWAQDDSLMQDAITKPSISLRCKEQLRERAEKIRHQQRLNALLQRNEDLIKKGPKTKPGIQQRLSGNQIRIKNELHLTNISIETMEENIVRSGCPGLSI